MENMKLFIENLKPVMSSYNGKGKFIYRLAEALEKQGVEIVYDPIDCDINLRLNGLPTNEYGIKVVRLDDVAFSNDIIHRTIYRKGLRRTKYAIKNADGIIYQSKVAKNTNEGILNVNAKQETIIYNGTDPKKHKNEFIELPKGKNFVHACQKLFPQRRVDKLLNCWDEFTKDKDDAYLHLVHDKSEDFEKVDFSEHKNVVYHNIMIQEDLDKFVYSCDAAISIKYQDSCPNFIIESIAVGTPVITTNTNGLAEILAEPQVIVANVDPYYTYKKVEWERPPFENKGELINALENIYQNPKRKFDYPQEIHIDTTAKMYVEFFEKLLTKYDKPDTNSIMRMFNTKFKNRILSKLKFI
jgi:glycosyltransferase involved in cell wall biosynthesis